MSRRLLSTVQVSDEIGVPVTTLRYWRSRNEGPRSFKVGRGSDIEKETWTNGLTNRWKSRDVETSFRLKPHRASPSSFSGRGFSLFSTFRKGEDLV